MSGKGVKVDTLWFNFKTTWRNYSKEQIEKMQSKLHHGRKAPTRTNDRKVAVDVYLLKSTDNEDCDSPPYPAYKIEMALVCEEAMMEYGGEKVPLRFQGSDIELLRKAMWGALDARFATQWEDWYLVSVMGKKSWDSDDGTAINVTYETVEKGIMHDGVLVLRKTKYQAHEILPWPESFEDDDGNPIACIPATEENTKLLNVFSERVKEVEKGIREMLKPKAITETLRKMPELSRLLPSGET